MGTSINQQEVFTLNGSAYSGDSSDTNVINFEEPSVTQQNNSAPVLLLNLLGVDTAKIGLHGYNQPVPGHITSYLEHSYMPLFFTLFQHPEHIRANQPNQIWATPGMGSVDANLDSENRKKFHSIAQPFSAPLGKKLSQFAHCYETLLNNSHQNLKNLLYVDNTGGNDLLSWQHLILPHFTTPNEFRRSLEYRFRVLTGQEPLNETGHQEKIAELKVIRFSVLPIDRVLISINTPGALMQKMGSHELVPIPTGSKAFLPIVWQTQFHQTVLEEDVLTPDEQSEFYNYIQQIKKIEQEECKKAGITWINIDDYVDLILQKLIYSQRYQLDQLVGDDGYHPREPLKFLLVLARALETKKNLNYQPTQEALNLFAQELGVSTHAFQLLFESQDPKQAFANFLDQISIKTISPTIAEQKKAAELFPIFFKMMRHPPQKQT